MKFICQSQKTGNKEEVILSFFRVFRVFRGKKSSVFYLRQNLDLFSLLSVRWDSMQLCFPSITITCANTRMASFNSARRRHTRCWPGRSIRCTAAIASWPKQPLVGWAMLSAARYPIRLFGAAHLPFILPHDAMLYAVLRKAHTVLAYFFFLMILAHAGAILVHTLIVRDGMLKRMVPWNARPPKPGAVAPRNAAEPPAAGPLVSKRPPDR